jgi:hypothetical protein
LLKYYLWALAEKAVCAIPLGEELAYGTDSVLNRNRGKSPPRSSYLLATKVKELVPKSGIIMDVGTGWFHHDAFLLYLLGDYTIYLFDVMNKARLSWIKNYLSYLISNQELISKELAIPRQTIQEKLEPLITLDSCSSIYKKCNFIPCITKKTETPFLSEDSIDFMVSNCVLNHIPPKILIAELHSLRRMLKKNGYMYHLLGHWDHWAFHDKKVNRFNYYRYSDAYYKRFFETEIEYQNRMVKQEWIHLFNSCHLRVSECSAMVDQESRNAILQLDHIDSRFSKYPHEELAAMANYVLLQRLE